MLKIKDIIIYLLKKKSFKNDLNILTRQTTSRTSWSTQSDTLIVAVSCSPPKSTCTMAGLNPVRRGPSFKKRCPIMRPAITKKSLSKSAWNKMVLLALKEQSLHSWEETCLILIDRHIFFQSKTAKLPKSIFVFYLCLPQEGIHSEDFPLL